ncbi:PfkB family carbohydrate kinase [Aeromicrobium sp.]|uniref:carbohydrate kinase family protein n=1 Tax=Aeromicrobium sp. TaxID=1871063 RepID=UPI001999CA05|nr:PfkB family carbohydrate kinase [Aeromicrobium sp.]MBC7633611.1 hypothetical protein [Aeromicrobium sp.]
MTAVGEQLVMLGELTLDDVIVENEGADWKQAGGGGLYSAVGARVWCEEVAVNCVVGHDYPAGLLDQLNQAGISTERVARSATIASIGLWLLYETDGARRQIEKRRGGSFAEVDAHRASPFPTDFQPAGVHIAPQSSNGQVQALRQLDGRDLIITLDVLIEPMIDRTPYLSGELFGQVDAFLPSEQEVMDLWGHTDIRCLSRWLIERGSRAAVVIKRGPLGVDVLVDQSVIRVPSVVHDLVDPTGAGDAFCGGFLAGLVATGDPVEAAVRGVVSSSFVCEARGALAAAAHIDPQLVEHRSNVARQLLREVT